MNDLYLQLTVAILIGIGAGYLGSFMVLKRMSLVGDALSHVALPGIALALIWDLNPFLVAFTALFLAIIGVWALEKKTELPSETLVGIFFTLSLAVGLLLTPEPELLEALFGDISTVNKADLLVTAISIAAIIAIMSTIHRGLTISTLSKDLAKSMNVSVDRINFLFLIMVSLIVALGLKVAGTLLMGSLVIIPAAAARNVSVSISRYVFLAALFGALASIGGIFMAGIYSIPTGPAIVLTGGAIFLITLVFKRS
ncbi:MAG: metal ABC transporter permease [Parcubacteria group bacterium]|nr:metal ABC transporter permease [Parcubacteria group bacterium]